MTIVDDSVVLPAVDQVQEESQVQQKSRRPWRLPRSRLFLGEGVVGARYVIADCEKAVEITAVGPGSVSVVYPATGAAQGISLHTEVIQFDSEKHAELIRRVVRPKTIGKDLEEP